MSDDEPLCIEVLKALQQMLEKESEFGEKVKILVHVGTLFGNLSF